MAQKKCESDTYPTGGRAPNSDRIPVTGSNVSSPNPRKKPPRRLELAPTDQLEPPDTSPLPYARLVSVRRSMPHSGRIWYDPWTGDTRLSPHEPVYTIDDLASALSMRGEGRKRACEEAKRDRDVHTGSEPARDPKLVGDPRCAAHHWGPSNV